MTSEVATNHIVSVSSGLGSAFAWKILCDKYGPENVTGVFTDVNGEHPDNYRFLAEVQYELGSRLVKIGNDGRTIWDVFIERRFLANTRVDLCSRILKREAFQEWLASHVDPAETTVYLGIDWTEIHRLDRARPYWKNSATGLRRRMCEPPYLGKRDAEAWLAAAEITRPALYDMGFESCELRRRLREGRGSATSGSCIFADPKWFWGWWVKGEERVRKHLGKNVAILRDRRGGGPETVSAAGARQGT